MSAGRKGAGTQSWFDLNKSKKGVPGGLWIRCDGCGATVFKKEVEKRFNVCPEPGCDHHFYISAPKRIEQLLDEDSFEEWFTDLSPWTRWVSATARSTRNGLSTSKSERGCVKRAWRAVVI